jgi:group II intron reverse transcriptase/maturase
MVRLVEIPKTGGGVRPLGIPTVGDRIAQTMVRGILEPVLEPLFHKDSYGYRPGKSALAAVKTARERCWYYDWVIDLDIQGFFDNIPHDLLMKAVKRHVSSKWILLYTERWLKVPLQKADGRIQERTKGVPQGSVIGPILANLYLHYVMDMWLNREYPKCCFERYADDAIIHCQTEREAEKIKAALEGRMRECGLELHPMKTKVVYCKDSNRKGTHPLVTFDFLGYTFKPRQAQNGRKDGSFTNMLPGVSRKAMKAMNEKMRGWRMWHNTGYTIQYIAWEINPVIRGWINYYGRFYKTKLKSFMRTLDVKLAYWAKRKYKRLRVSFQKAKSWLNRIYMRNPGLFAHWQLLYSKPLV